MIFFHTNQIRVWVNQRLKQDNLLTITVSLSDLLHYFICFKLCVSGFAIIEANAPCLTLELQRNVKTKRKRNAIKRDIQYNLRTLYCGGNAGVTFLSKIYNASRQ